MSACISDDRLREVADEGRALWGHEERGVARELLALRERVQSSAKSLDTWILAAKEFEAERDELREKLECSYSDLECQGRAQRKVIDELRAKLAALDVEPRSLRDGDEWAYIDDSQTFTYKRRPDFIDVPAVRILRIPVPVAAPESAPESAQRLLAECTGLSRKTAKHGGWPLLASVTFMPDEVPQLELRDCVRVEVTSLPGGGTLIDIEAPESAPAEKAEPKPGQVFTLGGYVDPPETECQALERRVLCLEVGHVWSGGDALFGTGEPTPRECTRCGRREKYEMPVAGGWQVQL